MRAAGHALGPARERVRLSPSEILAFHRLRPGFEPSPIWLATGRELRSALNRTTLLLLLWMAFRRRAVWLVPLGAAGMAATVQVSLVFASIGALATFVGLTALVTELRAAVRTRRPFTPHG